MSFPLNQLPEAFAEEHGTESADLQNGSRVELDSVEDEDLDLANINGSVWLVKVPKFLMERWSSAAGEGEILGKMRVYDEKDANGDPKIAVILDSPDEKQPHDSKSTSSSKVPLEYKLHIQNKETKNMFVFGEKETEELDDGGGKGKGRAKKEELGEDDDEEAQRKSKKRRTTSIVGTVHHECSLTPSLSSLNATASYSSIVRDRQLKAAQPKRTMKRLDVDQATANRLASGMGLGGFKARVATFGVSLLSLRSLTRTGHSGHADVYPQSTQPQQTGKPKSSADNRTVRIPKNELLDALFGYFATAPYWTIKALTEHLKQPQVYLREVLNEIAILVPRGPYQGMWTLKEAYKGQTSSAAGGAKKEGQDAASGGGIAASGGEGGGGVSVKKEEGVEENGDDEDDDAVMFEQVS